MRGRVRELWWKSLRVEAGPDVIFEPVEGSTSFNVVVFSQGYRPFPFEQLQLLLEGCIKTHGHGPEGFVVTATKVYAVQKVLELDQGDGG